MNNKLENDEKELHKTIVKYRNIDTQLTLTNKRLIFEQEKGLFRKKMKPIETILIDNIKMDNDKVKIEQNNKIVILQTNAKDVSFICNNLLDARKIVEKIISTKTGESVLDRVSDKTKKIAENATKVVVATGALATAIVKNRKTILKAFKTIASIFKK